MTLNPRTPHRIIPHYEKWYDLLHKLRGGGGGGGLAKERTQHSPYSRAEQCQAAFLSFASVDTWLKSPGRRCRFNGSYRRGLATGCTRSSSSGKPVLGGH